MRWEILLQDFFGFGGGAAHIDLIVDNVEGRRTRPADFYGVDANGAAAASKAAVAAGEEAESAALRVFEASETVRCHAKLHVPAGKKMDHTGLKAELKGVIGAL